MIRRFRRAAREFRVDRIGRPCGSLRLAAASRNGKKA
jgi:hypothetical protein